MDLLTTTRLPLWPSTSRTATSSVTTSLSAPSNSTVRQLPAIRHESLPKPEKQGISSRFLGFFDSLDHTVGHRVIGEEKTVSGAVNEQAAQLIQKGRDADQHHGVSKRFGDYYNKIIGTPVGQK